MKLNFAPLLALALLAFFTPVSSQFVDVTNSISPNEELIQGFTDFGVGYIIQKGMFESTKAPFPGLYYNLTTTEKIERMTTDTADYYRFVLLLTEQENQATVRANFTIQYNYINGTFLITVWRYNILSKSESHGGLKVSTAIDARPYTDGSIEEFSTFNARIQEVVQDGINRAVLPQSTYTLSFVYASRTDFQISYAERKVFCVKVVNTEGQIFRLEFEYYSPPETFGGDYQMIFDNDPWYLNE